MSFSMVSGVLMVGGLALFSIPKAGAPQAAVGARAAGGGAAGAGSTLLASTVFCTDTDGAQLACPCTASTPGAGCDTPQGNGVTLGDMNFDGTAQTVDLVAQGFPVAATPTCIITEAFATQTATAFGDGVWCLFGPNKTRAELAVAGAGVWGWSHAIDGFGGAGTYYYQVWFRSTPVSYCVTTGVFAGAFNLSNGLTLVW